MKLKKRNERLKWKPANFQKENKMISEVKDYTKNNPSLINKDEILMWLDTVASAAVKKEPGIISSSGLEHIVDYLGSGKAKSRLRKMSFKQAQELTKRWNDNLIKKAGNVIETEKDIEVIHTFKNGGVRLVKLKGKAAFEREGNLMRHCVGSYYKEQGTDYDIYSLRDSSNKPHITFEVNKEHVNQVKGKGNGPIHPKYIKYVLFILDKIFKLDIRESELQNLGYVKLSPETEKVIKAHMTGEKYIIRNNQTYYYKHANLKLKKD